MRLKNVWTNLNDSNACTHEINNNKMACSDKAALLASRSDVVLFINSLLTLIACRL